MAHEDIYNIFTLVANDKYIRFSALIITAFTVLTAVLFSPLAGLIIYGSYIFGYFVCWSLIKYQNTANSYLHALINFCYGTAIVKNPLRHSCSICDDLSCKRHQQTKVVLPWKDLHIQKDLNDSLSEFYNKILDNFISCWYSQFTNDKDFVNELRYCLKYASAIVINRFLGIDHADIIASKLLPCVVKHVDDYLFMQQITKLKNARLNDVIVEYLGKRLHAAASNRRSELEYLQHLSASLMPHVLPDKYLQCRNYSVLIREILAGWVLLPLMDVLADPNVINSLVILATTYDAKKWAKAKDRAEPVEFLHDFVTDGDRKSSFATDLKTIKENTDLLYAFMQFLKREEHVHLLKFCLDVDDFNDKLLTPDLSKKQLEDLHSEATTLYEEYLSKGNVNFIGCSEQIVDDFHHLIKDGVHNVAKLRTSKPLYQAYEHTFNVIENVWLPSFFHSNEFYEHICGSKITASYNKSSGNRSRKYYDPGLGTVAKLSSGLGKIRGALKSNQPVDGSLYSVDPQTIENGGTVEEIIISECSNIFRDLSTWRISILSYRIINKVVSFCVNVQRLGVIDDDGKRHWTVLRKDQDFYTLKAKLVEFHGENEICDSPLPSRKAGSPLDVRMSKYENFLTKLLQKSSLRGSDLLHSFLTAEADFTLLISTSAQNNQDIGNIYQSVAHKLRKEKGQHLDSFMSTYLQSTGKPKQEKFEWAELGDEVLDLTSTSSSGHHRHQRHRPTPKTFRNHIFNDNFGIQLKVLKDSSGSSINPSGFTECTFYLLRYVFKVPHYVLRLYVAVCNVAREIVESVSKLFIQRKLKSSLSPHNLSYLIKLLEGVIFVPHVSPSKQELAERKLRAFEELKGSVPSLLTKVVGKNLEDGCTVLLEILQHPHYNKQLVYNLLDLILIEMFPNLKTA